jgi:hypothetical protein
MPSAISAVRSGYQGAAARLLAAARLANEYADSYPEIAKGLRDPVKRDAVLDRLLSMRKFEPLLQQRRSTGQRHAGPARQASFKSPTAALPATSSSPAYPAGSHAARMASLAAHRQSLGRKMAARAKNSNAALVQAHQMLASVTAANATISTAAAARAQAQAQAQAQAPQVSAPQHARPVPGKSAARTTVASIRSGFPALRTSLVSACKKRIGNGFRALMSMAQAGMARFGGRFAAGFISR